MRLSEILRLVWLNLSQNKFKVILTSIGIVVGSATIMLVLAIGTGGKEEVAEQFKNLNAGAIDISCDSSDSGGFSFEMPGGGGSVTVTNMGGRSRRRYRRRYVWWSRRGNGFRRIFRIRTGGRERSRDIDQ